MALDLKTREVKGVAVLDLNGRLTYGEACHALHKQVGQLLATEKRKIVLNFKKVSYSDSAGLGYLAAIFISIRNRGGELKLVHTTEWIKQLLESTALINLLEVYDNEAEALASFK